jgi:hypothetical protein
MNDGRPTRDRPIPHWSAGRCSSEGSVELANRLSLCASSHHLNIGPACRQLAPIRRSSTNQQNL